MKRLSAQWIGLVLGCLLLGTPAQALETTEDASSRFSVGFDIDSFANNFGGGLTVSSPHFAGDSLHVQASGDVAWVQGVQNGGSQSTWVPYGLFKVGIFGGRVLPGTSIRVYGGGGVVLLTPSSQLSSSSTHLGGFGLAGVEIFVNKDNSRGLFVELGGMGTGATADKLVSAPVYANGFTISWGYKFYL